ncbi:hypothetical protein MRB53_025767 [Persea americana]|uniref:Uncharacterized protein n=1 Tax=Persea americana TaxID=3435 RepID=A0ACC2LG75_PERAE|nr:hypothetical protein MRB53_025767 [Persea americana]
MSTSSSASSVAVSVDDFSESDQGRRRADMAKTEIPVQEGKVCMKEKSGIRTPSAVRLALEFDGLNYFETLVSH